MQVEIHCPIVKSLHGGPLLMSEVLGDETSTHISDGRGETQVYKIQTNLPRDPWSE